MRTALDTNIISALWSNEPPANAISDALCEAKESGAVLMCGVVYAELLAYPGATKTFIENFCSKTGVMSDFKLQDAVWTEAGKRFAAYANRRRKAMGAGPKRLLADFLIGAHATLQADRLMTLDASRYKQDFPDLQIYPLNA
jgi:predicted nucleic acid-binding protein